MRKKNDVNLARNCFSRIGIIIRNKSIAENKLAGKSVKKSVKRIGAIKTLIISKVNCMSNVFKNGEKNILIIP